MSSKRLQNPTARFLAELSQYLGVRAVAGFMGCFDVEQNMHTAARLGSVYYAANATRRTRAQDSIRTSLPALSDDEVHELAERSMQHMFQLFMVESLAAPRLLTASSWPRHVRLVDLGSVLDRMLHGKPLIFITGHCGNWEVLGFSLAVLGFPLAALARPLDNRFLNRWLLGIREARGMRIITKWGATPVIHDVLDGGGRLGFTADQNAGVQGTFVPFFGRLASSYKSIGLLAMRYEIPIIAGHARRTGPRLQYDVSCIDVIEPRDWADQPDPLFYITARYNRAMERMIRNAPEQYLWLHRRWKSRPRHEREGKPTPGRLIEKLESLPWMTQEELDTIVRHSNASAAQHRQT